MASSVLSFRQTGPQAGAGSRGVVALDGTGHATSDVGGKTSSLEQLTGKPADRIAERAIVAYRTRLDGGVSAENQVSETSNVGG